MRRLVVFVAFLLAACGAPTPTSQQPTYTPLPTYTPYPTFTPLPAPASALTPIPPPTRPPASAPAAAKCIAWTEAATHIGETTCVRGVVYSTNKSGSTFFIDFDNTRASFYGVSFKHTWDNLRGRCVEITGPISPYRGRPQIVIESKEQVRECQ